MATNSPSTARPAAATPTKAPAPVATSDASASTAGTTTATPAPSLLVRRPYPRLGETVMVQAAPRSMLRNNETGGFISQDVPTPQTVTVTLLRRLADGDLVLK